MLSRSVFCGLISIFLFLLLLRISSAASDIKCAPRFYPNSSCVCVCNSTYCDTITREAPPRGKAFVYTTSEAGLRFSRTAFNIKRDQKPTWKAYTLELDPSTIFQTVEGYGGAVTDAAGINWASLKDPILKQSFIDSYFSDAGLQYNMLRVPIGGTDFSTHPYAYNEDYKDDANLENFSLALEDYKYKIPMIKACQKAASTELHIVSSVWSPPAWMKNNNNITGYSQLRKKYYQTFADYHCKFIHEYKEHGIPIWGITTTNEPINGAMDLGRWNTLGWSVLDMGDWIENNLGPTMHKNCPGVKILGCDDQRFLLPFWFEIMVSQRPGALKYLDGAAVHWYYNSITPAEIIKNTMKPYPGKFVISTEACEGATTNDVILGSWSRATTYIIDIIENMNNDVVGWIDWNLCLNTEGGPNWTENYVDSPIIVNERKGEFYKQPTFYAMGHFSKFVPRGSKRIKVTELQCESLIMNVAFLTPQDTIVVVMYNDEYKEKLVTLRWGNEYTSIKAAPRAIITVELQSGLPK